MRFGDCGVAQLSLKPSCGLLGHGRRYGIGGGIKKGRRDGAL
jgi:hypothetical protein